MESSFFERVFHHFSGHNISDTVQLVCTDKFDYVRLYTHYLSQYNKQNQLLLPEQYINPEIQLVKIKKNQIIPIPQLVEMLNEAGYEKLDGISDSAQFSVKGDTITVFSFIGNQIIRIDFFDDNVEKILLLDLITLRPIKEMKEFVFINFQPYEENFSPLVFGNYDIYSDKLIIFSSEKPLYSHITVEVDKISLGNLPLFQKNEKVFESFINNYKGYKFFYSGNLYENLTSGFKDSLEPIELPLVLSSGFIDDKSKTILFTDYEIFSTLNLSIQKKDQKSRFNKFFENEVNIGDYVVHEAHGIGLYKGIESKVVLGEEKQYAIFEYFGKEDLLVPFNQLHRVSKYVSNEGYLPKLTKLGTAEWESVRKKLKKNVEEIAKEILEIYAKKKMAKGIQFDEDNKLYDKFEKDFPYELTEDQIKTLNEVKADMESENPMDRLIIGDVGFGKTEIALRAAFKAVLSKKQVMVLAPTTVLVSQLHSVFKSRLEKYGVKVEKVSRFDGTNHNKAVIALANENKLDVIIGTHRLLSKDVSLSNLGLLVIDEEQRFGVKQKEIIRKLRSNIDVISMSATPIPRTLQMSLSGIKDISIVATPPKGRISVKTEIVFSDEIAGKVQDELNRGGQVFIVHNKIEDIETFGEEIKQNLNQNVKIAIGHGRLSGDRLEKIMFQFQNGEFDVLISTTIIENGIDIPTVNTIIIDDAQNFGLSQLYQLRGRVGRSDIQGFCYLVVPKIKEFISLHKNPSQELKNLHKLLEDNKIQDRWITPDAISRITAILANQELGAGFKIASRDLEIRGSGNILGAEQSGHINAVGYEMYIRLLEQEVNRLKETVEKDAENIQTLI